MMLPRNLLSLLAIMTIGWAMSFPATASSLTEGLEAYRLGQFRRASAFLGPLAESGDAQAQFTMALMYSSGRGVVLDEQRAAHLLQLAATQGQRDAAYRLAQIYEHGWGIPQSLEQAHAWYQRCAAQSELRCQERLKQWNVVEQNTNEKPMAAVIPLPSPLAAAPAPAAPITLPPVTSAPVNSEFRGADWVQAQNPAHYTIQILTSAVEKDLRNYVQQHNLTGDLAIISELRSGKMVYHLIAGSYQNSGAANRARATLPPAVIKAGPRPLRFRQLRNTSAAI